MRRERFDFDVSRRVTLPALTEDMRLVLDAIVICDGIALCDCSFTRGGVRYGISVHVLKHLLRDGLIEVMGLSPAVYRLTKLGRLARRFK